MKKILVFLLLIFYINAESVVFTYSVKANGRILPEVKSSDPDAYAGNIGQEITDIAIKASRGQVSYRVHVKNGGWLPYVAGYDWADPKKGYAGNGKPIDLVEVIATECDPLYRVSTLNGRYLPWQKENFKTGMDGYAGNLGQSIDRFQFLTSCPT